MRSVSELLSDDSAWPLIESWIAASTSDVRVLEPDRQRGEDALYRLQVTSHSALGAVALETAGIVIDKGWLRLLGSGNTQMKATLVTWNKIGDAPEIEPLQAALIVGFDAVGGFFALNGGEFTGVPGDVFYFAPDTLDWISLERGYADFVHWALTAKLDGFYTDLRWPGWESELANASPDQGFSLYPPPFVEEGRVIANVSRKLAPMSELWATQRHLARQMADLPDGTWVEFKPTP